MITKNFYTELLSHMANLDSSGQERATRLVDVLGNTAMTGTSSKQHSTGGTRLFQIMGLAQAVTSFQCGTTSGSGYGVYFGNGNVEPTFEDYCLSGEVIGGYVYTVTMSYEFDGNDLIMTSDFTITNNNAEPITISECALFDVKQVYSSKWYTYQYMLDRTLLETPITIEAGGVGQVTYTIRMNTPTA